VQLAAGVPSACIEHRAVRQLQCLRSERAAPPAELDSASRTQLLLWKHLKSRTDVCLQQLRCDAGCCMRGLRHNMPASHAHRLCLLFVCLGWAAAAMTTRRATTTFRPQLRRGCSAGSSSDGGKARQLATGRRPTALGRRHWRAPAWWTAAALTAAAAAAAVSSLLSRRRKRLLREVAVMAGSEAQQELGE